MSRYPTQPGCSRMHPLKRCKTKENADFILIDIDDDDDDVIVVDPPQNSHQKKQGSSEQREHRKVSPQSVISIEDDDSSYMNNRSAFDEEGVAEVESDATSIHRSGRAYGFTTHVSSECDGNCMYSRGFSSRNSNRFGDEEYEFEPVDDDSDCEVMEDSSGKLREQWEEAAKKKASGHKGNFEAEGSRHASVNNNGDVRQNDRADHFSEVPSFSNASTSFTGMKNPFTYKSWNTEETPMPHDHDTLFPEFDWRNLGGRSSHLKPKTANNRDVFQQETSEIAKRMLSETLSSQNNAGEASFQKGLDDQCGVNTFESQGTRREECSTGAQPSHQMNSNQPDSSKAHEINASCSYRDSSMNSKEQGEQFHTSHVECGCIFPSYCECRRNKDLDAEKVHTEEPLPNPCKEKINDSKFGHAPISSPVGTDCEANHSNNGSKEIDGELETQSHSETVVRQDSRLETNVSAVETDTNSTPEGSSNDSPSATVDAQSLKSDIINVKERLKETEEYKRTMEQEMALRQQQIKLQAEEAQRLRKRKKAESLRLSNLEKRQKQRLEEVRESQKQDGATLNLKEQLRSDVMKELKALELRCFDMATLLRSMGIQVEGGLHPSQQQVHAAYKRALLKFHPDRASGSNLKQQVEAEEKFKLISRMKEKFKFR